MCVCVYVSKRKAKSVKYTICVHNHAVQNILLSQFPRRRADKQPITEEKTTTSGRLCWRRATKTQRHVGVGSGEPVVVVVVAGAGLGLDRGGEGGAWRVGVGRGGWGCGGGAFGGRESPRSGRLMDEPVGRGKVECGPAPHSRPF